MSYLDVPRLHFSGLFFTGPSTVNNRITNYQPNTPLEQSGVYRPNAGWNPLGVAQWWLEECTVLSAVDSTGAPVSASSDTVIGAAVQSPGPKTPMSDGQGGYYDIAKMVDLDVQQQIRSALYGVRIAVILPNQAGFSGLLTVPELRQLNTRIPGVQGSWGAVGNWMGTLQNVVWSGDVSSSPFLTALKSANYPGLNVKLTVDLHQNNPANVFTSGDQFCYGRVLASIGPAVVSELPQVVPGRCLQTPTSTSADAALTSLTANNDTPPQTRARVAAKGVAIGEARAAKTVNALAAAAPDPWNPAFAIIRQVGNQTLLSIDIGGCIYLNYQGSPPTSSDGTFEVDSAVVGVVSATTNQFTPFVNGNISIAPQYTPLASTAKNTTLVKNSCVFSFPITPADGTSYKSNPLAIQVNGTTVAQENTDGSWMDLSVSSQRLECANAPQPGQAVLMVRKFGNPVTQQKPPVTTQIKLPSGATTTDVDIVIGNTDANGNAPITTNVKASSLNLPEDRQPLDSEVCLAFMTDINNGQPIGDGPSEGANLSVLLFNAYQAPANPTWNDVGAIFGAYGRLYPGMRSRFDISDQATVLGDPQAVLAHMDLPFGDPAYMPVTRDLSPSKMAMIISWLKTQVKP
ncbi:MAG TPA: hypothetical protein VFY67_04600 [Pyrinomonadaceae bacterium]|nr:hypothetical protein [Pyrinomonadaceae bacterium]